MGADFAVFAFTRKSCRLFDTREHTLDAHTGQHVLEGLGFQGGTELLPCIEEVAQIAFAAHGGSSQSQRNMMLVLTDAFTCDRDIERHGHALKAANVNLAVLAAIVGDL